MGRLLGQVARGDDQAFAALYDEVAPVYGIAHGMVGDADLAVAIAREVLVQVWQSAPRFTGPAGSELSWVLSMAWRHAASRRGTATERLERGGAVNALCHGHDRTR